MSNTRRVVLVGEFLNYRGDTWCVLAVDHAAQTVTLGIHAKFLNSIIVPLASL